jgi:23S rRNA pseudouridine1911/1915/1917 synthase
MELTILYEDADMVAISKPTGIITHADGRTDAESVASWFAAHYPESKDVGEPMILPDGTSIARPGIVHRLDMDTSGVIVLAKTPEAFEFLKNSFRERDAKKTYLAFVYGVPKAKRGTIDFAIGRSRKDFRLRSAQPKAKGMMREAITRYEILGDDGKYSLVKVMPETGRTHQIRVHLKAIHHPIVCDSLYAPNQACALGLNRLALHAYSLDIPLVSGGRKEIIAPLPTDLAEAVATFPGGAAFIASK